MQKSPERGRPKKETLRTHMIQGMTGVVILAIASFYASQKEWMTGWENVGLDSMLQIEHYRDDSILVVKISDQEYGLLFHSTSPLNPELVLSLVMQAAAAHPAVIVMDLDLAGSAIKRVPLPQAVENAFRKQLPTGQQIPKVIWPYPVEIDRQKPFLIKAEEPQLATDDLAVPLFPRDSGGSVRRMISDVTIKKGGDCFHWPTMPEAAAQLLRFGVTIPRLVKTAACDSGEAKNWSREHTYLLGFSGEHAPFNELDASSLLGIDSQTYWSKADNPHPKVVFIGGAYAAARDSYWTPAGERYGVDLMAIALRTLQKGERSTPVQETYGLLLDILLGAAILLAGYPFRPSVLLGIGYSIATAIVVPLALSYVAFRSWNHWIAFVPGIVASFLHLIYDAVQELRNSKKELMDLEEKNRALHRRVVRLKKRLAAVVATEVSTQVVVVNEEGRTPPPPEQVRAAGAG